MAKIINLLEYRNLSIVSNDGRVTQGDLVKRIYRIIARLNTTTCSNEELKDFIVNSFTINGIIETYNAIGSVGWVEMVTQMVEHEIYERNLAI